jgi:ElaB/YqjD/DUF883 family membrane-anchored ribosome-binding protein
MPNSKHAHAGHKHEPSDDLRQSANELRDAASQAVQSVQKMGTHARNLAQERIGDIREAAGDYYEQGREQASQLKENLEETIRDKPLRSALIAAGIGMLLGILWMRR